MKIECHTATDTVVARVIPAPAPPSALAGSDAGGGVSRLGHHGIGGTDCNYDGPFGSYTCPSPETS
jgi:hypothetical protein